MTPEQSQIDALRQLVDEIDRKLLALLNERSKLSLKFGRIKASLKADVHDPQRESLLVEGLLAQNTGPLPAESIRSIWKEIFVSSRKLQQFEQAEQKHEG